MSGHSKWHNIQKTKGAADAKRYHSSVEAIEAYAGGETENEGMLLVPKSV